MSALSDSWMRDLFGYCATCGRPRTPQNEGTPCPAKVESEEQKK